MKNCSWDAKRKGPYFEGWYFKHQTPQGRALALIPAIQIDPQRGAGASLQVISDRGAWWLEYPAQALRAGEGPFQLQLGQNRFGETGMEMDIHRDGLRLFGRLDYGAFTPLRSSIMGPFQFLPMECAHGVISMGHGLEGTLTLNGERLSFSGGRGYVETDRGRSFPQRYFWTQCSWGQEASLMLSIATIPRPVRFTGCICAVIWGGREYRLATYTGARAESWSDTGALVRQGKYRLSIEVLEGQGHPLRAPMEGQMNRVIRESVRATVRYRFWIGGQLLFDHTDPAASFEYDDGREGRGQSVEI